MSNSEESDVASELGNKIEEENDDTSEAESGDDAEGSAAKAPDDLEKDGSDDKVVTWQDLVSITGRLVIPQNFVTNIKYRYLGSNGYSM